MHAIIDIGSNTIRLAIYKVEDGKATALLNKKDTAGLASFVVDGVMTEAGIDRAADVLNAYKLLLHHFHIGSVHAFATAALRNIANSEEAVGRITLRTGMAIAVLTGEEEAALDFVGAASAMELQSGILIDIGGASTELVAYQDGRILNVHSMPIGSLNTYDRFVGCLIPNKHERKAIKQAVLDEIGRNPAIACGQYERALGVGGTIRAAGKLNNYLFDLPAGNVKINAPNVKKMIKFMEHDEEEETVSRDTLDILLKVAPDRVRTVLPGMIILNTLVKLFRSETIHISAAGVREGYLLNRVLKISSACGAPDRNG